MSTQTITGNKTRRLDHVVSGLACISELSKVKITVFVAFTTALGYIVAAGSYSFGMIYPVAGIFLLACSSAMFNHIQEWKFDSLMERTMNRPIPLSKFSLLQSWILAVITFSFAIVILYFGSNPATLVTGLVTLVWYNFVYTPLKRKSSLAIIPGSVVGALPPVAGWFAADGSLNDLRIWIIFAFFFVWQIPHFWLLLLIYKDDYKNAGFPVLTDKLSFNSMTRLVKASALLTAAIAIVYVFSGSLNYYASSVSIIIASVMFSGFILKNLNELIDKKKLFRSFISINMFSLIFITILILDKLLKAIL